MCGPACSAFVRKKKCKTHYQNPTHLAVTSQCTKTTLLFWLQEATFPVPNITTMHFIRHPILPIPLPEVVIPILHLHIGIFPWIYDTMCKDFYQLEVALSQSSAVIWDSSQFQALISSHQSVEDARTLHERAETAANDVLTQLQYLLLHTQSTTTENVYQAATIIHAQWREKQGEAAGLAKSYDEQKRNREQLRAKHGKRWRSMPSLTGEYTTAAQH